MQPKLAITLKLLALLFPLALPILFLSSCASLRTKTQPLDCTIPTADNFYSQQRRWWLAQHPHFVVDGRIAVSQDRHGGSAQITWEQTPTSLQVRLSAPITHQSWLLASDTTGKNASLSGMAGGTRYDTDADRLLRNATGWSIPISTLAGWITATAQGTPTAPKPTLSDPIMVKENDWTISYIRWMCVPPDAPAFPSRIEAHSQHTKVRLIIDAWNFTQK